ncbi:N-acyl homoserine lactone synthase [Paraburkholderia tropica]|uniref:acyl-homoserine-lactone synthase n=1 Tax=Paraburkholderia tropica TaxID=92647 RepID=UPI0015FF920B|nr:acyl-homoserine-lactone synthase [Paraburkholderia tropica]QNB16132.1 N-acyl homoserine lactone synthase [Paraburkholderia tropica]
MSFIVAGRLDALPSPVRDRLGNFRHKIFVQRLQWKIPGVAHDATSEWDKFDGGNTVHLVAMSDDQRVCGCARLMCTTGPYLLRDAFPELAEPGGSPPSSPSIWEMSRFAGSGLCDRTGSSSGMGLFPYVIALAQSFGATHVIGVVTPAVARLYRRFGLDLHDISNVAASQRARIVACSIDVDAALFKMLERDPQALLCEIACYGQLGQPLA